MVFSFTAPIYKKASTTMGIFPPLWFPFHDLSLYHMMDKLLYWYFFLLPFQFALNPLPGFDLALSRIVALGIGMIFLWQRLRAGTWIIPPPRVFFPLAGWIFLAIFSMLWAQEPYWALRKSLFLVSFLPIWFACAESIRRGEGELAVSLARGFFYGAVLSALVALIQFFAQWVFSVDQLLHFWFDWVAPFFLGETFSQSVMTYPSLLVHIGGGTVFRAVGVFPDPHVAAFYFGMALPFGLWLGARSAKRRGLFFLGSGIVLIADLCTFSRGGYVGLVALLIGFLVWEGVQRKIQFSLAVFWRGALFVMVILLLGWGVAPLRERTFDIFSLTEGSNAARVALWEEAFGYIRERPWLGYGLGNYPLQVKPSTEYREPIYIHNMYLDVVAELGLTGLFFILIFFSCFGSVFFCRGEAIPITVPAALALILFFSHSFFETALFSVHIFPVLLFLQSLFPWYTSEGKSI